ncbi:MAG: PKD domain-containing protein [Flavobacteriales bacterium]
MKKLLLISAFFISTSMMFGQFMINYSGGLNNHPTNAVMMFLEVDSVVIDSIMTNPSTAGYSDSITVMNRPFMIRILFDDCHGTRIADWHSPSPNVMTYNVNFNRMDYCPVSPCNASFSKFQAIDPVTRLPIPNKVILVDGSTGTSPSTYSWNFGDGSAPLTGLNVTHTYATHGSYNICLTVSGTTAAGTVCTSTYCDTLTVDSTGNVRSAFTVTTGNSMVSLDEKKSISAVKLYPNPAQNFISLNLEADNATELIVTILDTKGAVIQSIEKNIFSGSNVFQLSTNELQEGLYLIQLRDGKSIVTKRFQVVK